MPSASPLQHPIDVSPLEMGDPAGTYALRLTTRCIERDGRPWFPIMAEYHFSRDLPERWETELRKIRSGGVTVVATYVLWILHEEVRGRVRWDGARDLRRFVETAHRVGLRVVIRIGPWAHGETRNGGFPDWLQELPVAHRTDDPAYLELVRGWFTEIAAQVAELFHDEAHPERPIIGVQVENELYDQPDHLSTLRRTAEDVGIRASLWTATGWGGAQLPAGQVLPVYAGYSDGFWEESTVEWPAFGRMHFTFSTIRDDLSVGADLRGVPVEGEAPDAADDPWPFATCELGGGMQVAYHRRPHVDPDDVAALALVKLGSGSAWQGYYLYHGATQMIGELSTTQESQATGYPNDVPVRDYDFFAPIGREGQQRPHYHALRRQHLLLEAYGDRLAAYPAILPPSTDEVRWSVRGDQDGGFLFINNHQPDVAALADSDDVRFAVEFADRTITLPQEPFRLRSGVFAAWPLRQRLGTIDAVSATAQPITEVTTSAGTVVLLAAAPGVPVELQVEGVDASRVRGGHAVGREGITLVRPLRDPGLDCIVEIDHTTFVILDERTADAVWKGEIDGAERILIWSGEGWFDDDGFRAVQNSESQTAFLVGPTADAAAGGAPLFSPVTVPGAGTLRELLRPTFGIRAVAPVVRGGSADRLAAPTDDDFAALAPVAVPIDDDWFDGDDALILEIDWVGDAIRVSAGDELLIDQFWSGRRLDLDLVPHRETIRRNGLSLRAFAWAPDSEVHVDRRVRPTASEPVLEVRDIRLRSIRTHRIR